MAISARVLQSLVHFQASPTISMGAQLVGQAAAAALQRTALTLLIPIASSGSLRFSLATSAIAGSPRTASSSNAIVRMCGMKRRFAGTMSDGADPLACATAYAERARASYQKGQLRLAKLDYARASAELEHQSLPIMYNSALAHAADGDFDQAIEVLRAALALPLQQKPARFDDGAQIDGHEQAFMSLLEYSLRSGRSPAFVQHLLHEHIGVIGSLEKAAWLRVVLAWHGGHQRNVSADISASSSMDTFEKMHLWGHLLVCSVEADQRLDRKDLLAAALRGLRQRPGGRRTARPGTEERAAVPDDQRAVPLHPDAFVLPADRAALMDALGTDSNDSNDDNLWVLKPASMADGNGVRFAHAKELRRLLAGGDASVALQLGNGTVAQRYVSNPLLWEGKKFDLRLYVLVSAVRPARLYLYKDGYARLAPANFTMEGQSSKVRDHKRDRRVHITNRSEHNKKTGRCARPLSDMRKALFGDTEHNGRWQRFWGRVEDMLAQAFLAVLAQSSPFEFKGPCNKVYGVDVLVDDNDVPHLLEVNRAPAVDAGAGCPEIKHVHEPLAVDVLQKLLPAQSRLLSTEGGRRMRRLSEALAVLPSAIDADATVETLQAGLVPVLAEKDVLLPSRWTTLFPAASGWQDMLKASVPCAAWSSKELALTEATSLLLASV